MNALLLGAVLCFDEWCEGGGQRFLGAAWALFVLGCLTKEYVYIWPLFAAVIVWLRPCHNRAVGVRQVALMMACVGTLLTYRRLVLPHPYYPAARAFHFVERPIWYFSSTLWRYVVTGDYWLPGLAVLLVALGPLLRWLQPQFGTTLSPPTRWLGALLAVSGGIYLYLALSTPSPIAACWFIFDRPTRSPNLRALIYLLLAAYSLLLLWKYRQQEPTLVAWLFLWLTIIPVLPLSLYWHYQMPMWFMRCGIYWPLLTKLVWREALSFELLAKKHKLLRGTRDDIRFKA